MRGEPTDFWGKLDQDEAGRVLEWNPVEAHCADVAASCEALLRDTLLGARFAHLIGRSALHPVLLARLVVLAALHDLGKYAISFQNRPYPARQPQGGHVEPIVKALSTNLPVTHAIAEILGPLDVFGEATFSYLAASISHHGRPEKIGEHGSSVGFDARVFEPARGLDPLAGMKRLFELTRRWCPEAFTVGPPEAELPDSAEAQHFFAGIVMLADWLGSDKRVFAFVAYFRRHVAPRTWTPVVVRGLVEGAEDERHAIVERERCVADDVAYAAWVRRGEPPLFRPLHGGDSALGVRECAFWLRLARLRRRDAAWLASHEVPEEWRPIVAALHGGPVPELPGLARVYGYLAREGTAPPPSVLGEPLDVRAIDSYAWAWHAWMERAFDDRATLAPHLSLIHI